MRVGVNDAVNGPIWPPYAWVEVEDRDFATMLKPVGLSEPVVGVILNVY